MTNPTEFEPPPSLGNDDFSKLPVTHTVQHQDGLALR